MNVRGVQDKRPVIPQDSSIATSQVVMFLVVFQGLITRPLLQLTYKRGECVESSWGIRFIDNR